MKPGDIIELRTGKIFTDFYDADGFTSTTLWEKDGSTMLILGEENWGRGDLFRVLLHGSVKYVFTDQVQRLGEPNPWLIPEEFEEDY